MDLAATPWAPATTAHLEPAALCRNVATRTQLAPSPTLHWSRSHSQSADRQLDNYDSPTFPYLEKITKIGELFAEDDIIQSHPPSPPRMSDPGLASR